MSARRRVYGSHAPAWELLATLRRGEWDAGASGGGFPRWSMGTRGRADIEGFAGFWGQGRIWGLDGQRRTTVLGVPCITMRQNTERPITCEVGTNVIVGNDPGSILSAARMVIDGQWRKGSVPEKWDGHAAGRIVEWLVNVLGAV